MPTPRLLRWVSPGTWTTARRDGTTVHDAP